MVVDENDFIYYISKSNASNGICRIVEIDPTQNEHQNFHKSIYDIKTKNIHGFNINDSKFYIITDNKLIFELDRIKDSRDLKFVADYNFMEDSKKEFHMRCGNRRMFDYNCIINDKYVIQKNKIYYIYD